MNKYYIHDARRIDELPLNKKIDLIITSPPYFDMKDYGSKNQIGFGQKYNDYLDDIELVFSKCFQITKDTGSLWIIVDILRKDGEVKLLPFDMIHKIQASGWKLKDIIIWQKDKTVPFSHNGEMRNIFEYILFFTKTDKFKFYRDRITTINDLKEWWQKYPERYSPSGKSPTNIWEFPIPLQGSWGTKYIKHFCPLPEALIERIIHLCSDVHDVVLDPFAGSGSVLSAAYRLNRYYIGSDLNEKYREMFLKYITSIKPVSIKQMYSNKDFKRFSRTIEKLRALKFAKKLAQEYVKADSVQSNPFNYIVVIPSENKKPVNKLKIAAYRYIYVTDQQISKEIINILVKKVPLSKYGIEHNISIYSQKEVSEELKHLIGKRYYKYDNGVTYKEGKPVNLDQDCINLPLKVHPPIYSTIKLNETELNLMTE